MKNWENWSYKDLKLVIRKAKLDGDKSVSLSQHHTDHTNDKQVEAWLTEMGLEYKVEMERTIIFL
ncbi:hypothetical protein CN918_29350 [Priestia megaterium]|nr:hypothetical protein CN918_29350 [Priestia megaterium]